MAETANQSMLDYLNILGNDVVEVRVKTKSMYAFNDKRRTGFTCFGYYEKDKLDQLVADVILYDVCNNVESIYCTIQDIDDALIARAENRIQMDAKTGQTTSMSDVVNYRWFPVDIDPARPSKISSSKKELDKSKDVAAYLVNDLLKNFNMVKAMSGNGYHLMIPIEDFPNTIENSDRWKRVGSILALDIINKKDGIEGDTQVYSNPTFKLYGSTARKGDSTNQRPHRISIVKIPDKIEKYKFEDIETLLMPYEDKNRYVPKSVFGNSKTSNAGGNGKYSDLKEFLDKHNIPYETPKQTNDGTVYPMNCVFDENHGLDSFAIQKPDGRWGWKCFHQSCEGFGWHDFRDKVAPKTYNGNGGGNGGSYVKDKKEVESMRMQDIDDSLAEDYENIHFPEEVMEGLPALMMTACKERKDIKPEYIHAVTFNNMGAILGRRVYLKDDPAVFPNLYTVIVGETGFAQKSQVTKLGKVVLKMADQNVIRQTSLATAEGLINLFVFPNKLFPGCNIPEDYEDFFKGMQEKEKKGLARYCETFTDEHRNLRSMVEESAPEEGFRMQLVQNELGALLKKSNKSSGLGLRETLTELYDMEDKVDSPTKVNPTTAHYPCFSMIGSTTQAWLEKNIDVDDIHAGFVNRFAFYETEDIEIEDRKMFNPTIDKGIIQDVAKIMNKLRSEMFQKETGFTVDDEAISYCEDWHTKTMKNIASIESDIVRDSLKRFALHCKKYALLYAIFDNAEDDTVIHKESMQKACLLTTYQISVARRLFSQFTASETQKIEDMVFKKIRENGLRGATPRDVANSTRRASLEQVQKAIDVLEKANFIGRTPVPYNPGYFRFHAIKDLAIRGIGGN